MKIIIRTNSILIVILFFLSCSGIQQKYQNTTIPFLVDNDKNHLEDSTYLYIPYQSKDFIIYELSYFTLASGGNLPKSKTQYILVPRNEVILNDTTEFFEVFRYSNYSEKVKFKSISGQEYDDLMKYIENIKYYVGLECDRAFTNKLNLQYRFYINLEGFKEKASVLSLWSHNDKVKSQYYCLQSYLNNILFYREIDYYGNRIFNKH